MRASGILVLFSSFLLCINGIPFIMTTWENGQNATTTAWRILVEEGGSALDAVERGIAETCELMFCGYNIGPYGVIDENGEFTFDAMVFDGPTHRTAGVGGLRRVRNAIGVARAVYDYTEHSLIVGDMATEFAISMGFEEEDLTSDESIWRYENWTGNNCQPNFRMNVSPDPRTSCGPYTPLPLPAAAQQQQLRANRGRPYSSNRDDPTLAGDAMDTICQIIIDENSDIVVGTSTNGLSHKVPGRVGDTPIPGGGGYVDNDIGAAIATGNGDVMVRFLPSYQAVESLRQGLSPQQAAEDAIMRIVRYYPDFTGAVLVAAKSGEHGVACNALGTFPYALRTPDLEETTLYEINCLDSIK